MFFVDLLSFSGALYAIIRISYAEMIVPLQESRNKAKYNA